jgi:hypothetical protein
MAVNLIASDDFNRASLDANWSQRNPNWSSIAITASTVFWASASNANNEACAAWVGSGTPTNDHRSEVSVVTFDFQSIDYCIGVACRVSTDIDGARDFYFAFVAGTSGGPNYTTVLGKVVNGTRTVLHSASVSWTAGDEISISCVGSTISVQKNTVDLGGSFTQTDTDLTTGTWGIIANGPALQGDNWNGYSITGGTDVNLSGQSATLSQGTGAPAVSITL